MTIIFLIEYINTHRVYRFDHIEDSHEYTKRTLIHIEDTHECT